jgi:exonuclease SbcC
LDLLRLHLQNFTSYQNQEIDLQNLHVVGLLGANGSGKSSFIEAIVWALYGEGTKGSRKSTDNYVRIGADSCMVALDFIMSGHIYRVVRSWDKVARKGTLVLFVFEEDWVPKGKNATETQLEIERILGMDYLAFTATAVSPQGESGSFTNCSDADRKTILSYIMDLALWDRVQKRASSSLKLFTEVELRKLTTEVGRITNILSNENNVRKDFITKSSRLRELGLLVDEQEKQELSLKFEIASYADKVEQKDKLMDSLEKLNKDYLSRSSDLKRQIFEDCEQLEDVGIVVSINQESIVGLKELLAQSEEIKRCHEEYLTHSKIVKGLESKIQEYQDLTSKLTILELKEDAWKEDVQRRLRETDTAIEQAKKASEMLDNLPCYSNEETMSACPLIKEALSNSASLISLGQKVIDIMKEQNPYLDEWNELVNKINELRTSVNIYDQLKTKLVELEDNELEFAKLSDAIVELKLAEERLESNNRIKQHIENAIMDLEHAKETLEEEYNLNIETISDSIDAIKLDDYDIKLEQLKQLTESINSMKTDTNKMREEVGALRMRLADIEAEHINYETATNTLSSLEKKIEIYKVIEKASSRKGGVPALIIENAIPEIEKIANELLSRVTEGRFSIQLETQVESKTTDNVQEVLKIFVLDDGIARPYQTYSGAQKFILDLSLRVAVCKFLARRTGKEVKILIIDEGFSALDGENLPKVMEAIDEIAGDFNKVFIVTHIQNMKEVLPQRIHFTMTPSGTKVTVQGEAV